MKPPDRDTTREALKYAAINTAEVDTLAQAAEAWARIAPDANGEFPDEVVEAGARAAMGEDEDQWLEVHSDDKDIWRNTARLILDEIVRLAEGGDE